MSEVKIGLIGGSGLGAVIAQQTDGIRHDLQTPFGKPSDVIVETQWSGLSVLILNRHGPGHLLNPSQVPYRANIFALKQLGCTHILASGAVGSLREEFRPQDLVLPDQMIDKTFRRAGTFFENAAVHIEFAEPFCPVLRQKIMDAAKESSGVQGSVETAAAESGLSSPEPRTPNPEPSTIHSRGCYVCMEGPAFSTKAEALMHRLWGGDLIGMTAMPEAKLAREAEISYALIALVTDYDCWRSHATAEGQKPDPFALLNEIIANLNRASESALALMKKTVELISHDPASIADCPAHHALRLGIWSDKSKIPQDQRQLLAPLWLKYFE